MISFVIYGDPTPKGRPRFGRGMVYTPYATVKAESDILIQSRPHKPTQPLLGPLMVTLDFFLSIPASWSKVKHEMANTCAIWPTSKKDIDNLCKTVLDALNKIFYKDDSQIVKLYASKRYAENPRVEIKIQSIKI